MDIEEAKKKKAALESLICDLINTFEEETHVKIYDIDFRRVGECNPRGSYIYNVALEVRL